MIIDLDAHQGNGHEKDFGGDGKGLSDLLFSCAYFCPCYYFMACCHLFFTGRVYTLDMYNSGIYPFVST
jgi:histone deacetylase 11